MYPRVARQLIFVQKRLLNAVARMTSPIEVMGFKRYSFDTPTNIDI